MRLLAPTLALAVILAGAMSAQAAPVQHAAKSPAEVSAYWTKDRMQNAIPRDVVRGNGPHSTAKPGGSGGTSTWTRLAVPTPYSGADRNSGKVFFTMSGVNYVCSGTSVAASSGLSLVWTAGHCVNEGPGPYATNFIFVPAYLDGAAPYGKWAGSTLQTTSQWASSGNFTYDVGAVRVVPGAGAPPSGTLANITAPRPMAFNYGVTVNSTRFKSYGYPAAGRFNGQRMYMCDSPVVRRDGSTSTAPMGIGCDMTGGSSGGGWINSGGAVASVNSYIYYSLKNVMHGPYQGTVAQSLYNAMD